MDETPAASEEGGSDSPFAAMDPETARHPQPMFKELRDSMPVMSVEGMGVVVTRKVEVDEVFRHPEIFSSNVDAVDLKNHRPMIPLQIDPPEHKKYRKLLDPIFAPRQMALIEDSVATTVNDLIDGFIDRGEVDFAKEFSVPFPSQVFLTLLGLPLEELHAVPDHEGRDHPARPWSPAPGSAARRPTTTSRRSPTRSTTTSTRSSTSASRSGEDDLLSPVPRRRGGRGPG